MFSIFCKIWPAFYFSLTLRPTVTTHKSGSQVSEANGLVEWVRSEFLTQAEQLASLLRCLVAYTWNQWQILRSCMDTMCGENQRRESLSLKQTAKSKQWVSSSRGVCGFSFPDSRLSWLHVLFFMGILVPEHTTMTGKLVDVWNQNSLNSYTQSGS